jgi:fumarate reductase (CoM/CoB) subunit A
MIISKTDLQVDVLVIGAGGAGLRAAIAAKTDHADVLVVTKGDFPHGCNTALAGGMILAPLDPADSQRQYAEDTLRAGGGVNYAHLVEVMAAQASQRALDLERYGIAYASENGTLRLHPSPDCAVARGLIGGRPYSGDFFDALVREAARLGIPVKDRFFVMSLIQSGGAVVGAVGLDAKAESLIVIRFKSVVLATGGAGGMYAFTTNSSGISGDGLVLALKAGAVLSHLEFVLMRQCIIHPESLEGALPPFDGFVSVGGRYYNGLHERYMRRYHPLEAEAVSRAEITKCAQLEIMAGRGSRHGGVYGDLSDVPQTYLQSVKIFMDACRAVNFDPGFQCYEWAPASHHCMGGVVISEACQTGVPGLFAAGEVVAGVQGANRIGGNALTETQVFGAIAGLSASEYARTVKAPVLPADCASAARQRLETILNRRNGIDYRMVRAGITEVMSKYVGVIRHADGLRQARTALAAIEEKQIRDLCVIQEPSFDHAVELLEVENMVTLGKLTTEAATLRTESRGTHNRQDYPQTDPAWEKHIVFRQTPAGVEAKVIPAASVNA